MMKCKKLGRIILGTFIIWIPRSRQSEKGSYYRGEPIRRAEVETRVRKLNTRDLHLESATVVQEHYSCLFLCMIVRQ